MFLIVRFVPDKSLGGVCVLSRAEYDGVFTVSSSYVNVYLKFEKLLHFLHVWKFMDSISILSENTFTF